MQKQKNLQKRANETDETVVESEHARSDEVSAEAEDMCCVIDDLLCEVSERELTDDEIVEKGRPEWVSWVEENYSEFFEYSQDKDTVWTEADKNRAAELYVEYEAAVARFREAYENVTGMVWMPSITDILQGICSC